MNVQTIGVQNIILNQSILFLCQQSMSVYFCLRVRSYQTTPECNFETSLFILLLVVQKARSNEGKRVFLQRKNKIFSYFWSHNKSSLLRMFSKSFVSKSYKLLVKLRTILELLGHKIFKLEKRLSRIPGRNNPGILKLFNSGQDPYWLLKRHPAIIFTIDDLRKG